MDKKNARLRRARSTRARIRELDVPRLSVLRTGQHLYAQVFTADGSKVLAAASTTQADVREPEDPQHRGRRQGGQGDRREGEGRRHREVAFDRSGYRYHGRVKALADAPARRPAVLTTGWRPTPPMRAASDARRLLRGAAEHCNSIQQQAAASRTYPGQTKAPDKWQKNVHRGAATAIAATARKSTTA